MECVTMNTIIASRSSSRIWRSQARCVLELCTDFRFDGPVLVTFLGSVGRRLVASFTHRVNSSIGAAHGRVLLPAHFT